MCMLMPAAIYPSHPSQAQQRKQRQAHNLKHQHSTHIYTHSSPSERAHAALQESFCGSGCCGSSCSTRPTPAQRPSLVQGALACWRMHPHMYTVPIRVSSVFWAGALKVGGPHATLLPGSCAAAPAPTHTSPSRLLCQAHASWPSAKGHDTAHRSLGTLEYCHIVVLHPSVHVHTHAHTRTRHMCPCMSRERSEHPAVCACRLSSTASHLHKHSTIVQPTDLTTQQQQQQQQQC